MFAQIFVLCVDIYKLKGVCLEIYKVMGFYEAYVPVREAIRMQ